ncbi:DUF4913 domain-containing protein [Streptomyces xinghaiensis]|uniref:DUF4913 domain-containing protein n=1 Tax=Streptomyces xinghaiensis TaxID=1038928 RepID=UPI0037B807A3
MSDLAADSADEPIRVPDHDLDDLAATLERLIKKTEAQGRTLERLKSDGSDTHSAPGNPEAGSPEQGDDELQSEPNSAQEASEEAGQPASVFIPALDNEAYGVEVDALTAWVNHLLLPVYGREITTSRPWCHQWQDHPEAVARLHALWLAWQQFTDVEAGLAGPSVWHRDHLDPAWLQLRAPDGPFSACTTNPNRPHHRLLPTPAPEAAELELAA